MPFLGLVLAEAQILQLGTNGLLFLLIMGLAGAVEFKDFAHQFEERRGLLTGIFCQFFLLPLTGFLVVKSLQLDEVIGTTLLVATSSPGGSFSNWWCSVFNVDLALSVALTTISTACSVFMLPLNLFVYARLAFGHSVQLNWASLSLSIAVVLAGVGSGLCISARFPERRSFIFRLGNLAGVILISTGIFYSSRHQTEPIWGRPGSFYLGVGSPPLIGLIVSMLLANYLGLPKPQCVSVSIETCYQNTGVALTVALSSFHGETQHRAAGVPVFYMACQFTLLVFTSLAAWKLGWTYAPPGVKLHKFLTGNYQPSHQARRLPTVGDKVVVSTGAEHREDSKGQGRARTLVTSTTAKQPADIPPLSPSRRYL